MHWVRLPTVAAFCIKYRAPLVCHQNRYFSLLLLRFVVALRVVNWVSTVSHITPHRMLMMCLCKLRLCADTSFVPNGVCDGVSHSVHWTSVSQMWKWKIKNVKLAYARTENKRVKKNNQGKYRIKKCAIRSIPANVCCAVTCDLTKKKIEIKSEKKISSE